MTTVERVGLAVVASVFAFTSVAQAEVFLSVTVDPPTPVAGQPFRINYGLRVQNGGGTRAMPLQLPGLDVLANPSPPGTDGIMFGGGGGMVMFTMESSVSYIVRARAPGRYTISNARAIDVQSNRVVAQHPNVTVQVLAPGAAPPVPVAPQPGMVPIPAVPPGFPPGLFQPDPPMQPQPDPAPQPDAPPVGDLTGASYSPDGFLRVAVDNPTPYVGQQLILRAWLYVPAYEAMCEPLQEPALTGFWSEALFLPDQHCTRQWYPQNVMGRTMMAGLVRKMALFPTRAGRLEIGSSVMRSEFIEGDAFFGSRRQVELRSPALVIDVREQPSAGRPEGYVPGTLGPLAIQATLDRPTVPVGETLTLTVRAEGNGYLGSVGIPAPRAVDGIRMHPGASRSRVEHTNGDNDTRGILTNDYLLVPTRPGRFELGVLNVPWFDPTTGEYHTATVPLPTLEATGAAAEQDADAQRDDPATELEPFKTSPALDAYSPFFTSGARVWGAIALPPAALALLGLSRALRRWRSKRRHEEEHTSRNDPASLLRQAESAQAAADTKRALDLAGRALDRACKDHDPGALDADGKALVSEARTACDTLRFAGAEGGDVRAAIGKVRAALVALERVS
jgi:hypothetical protein